ncbi:MAG: GNAT family N-acetyltransferase, partial [Armatimonadota bacterium]|nr:GNAT family N-acetyltransferase [Armatimonadota bacterium]
MTERVTLRDGREMQIRPARSEDAKAIAAEHPIPREGRAPDRLYRNYYLAKTLIYVRAPGAGVTTGWVDGCLGGFVFHCRNLDAVRRFTRAPRTLLWLASEAVRGRFGYHPGLWLEAARWATQHFRQPPDYSEASAAAQDVPEIEAWIGTVHTVDDFRRLGVATHLLASAEEHLEHQGAAAVALWVASDNEPAKSLYRKRAYERAGDFGRVGERCDLLVKDLTAGRSPAE